MLALKVAAVVGLLGAVPILGRFGGQTVEMSVKHSRFSVQEVVVEQGTTVKFVIRNDDPIDHEFIVGDEEVHARHEKGTERRHSGVPGAVSVPAKSSAETTFTFDRPGRYRFACHLPGHLSYGMVGTVRVTG